MFKRIERKGPRSNDVGPAVPELPVWQSRTYTNGRFSVMPFSIDEWRHHTTYFGLWSAAKAESVSTLLDNLGVRYEFIVELLSEERLTGWTAWDPTAANPNEGRHLFIHSDDLEKVGTHIIEMFPERN